ncbi:MAG: insulinase family protein [Desulfobulbaceae bacterium]|nr:insulinase family protein [Desulfobulbaceae bacterium]
MHNKTVFDNGLRVVSEQVPHARTVSVGIWVDVGVRDEHDLINGCSHFVEHMLFKGTEKRSANRIAREMDVLGGMTNAFTSKDATCYYGTVLDIQLPQFIDLLADFFFHSAYALEEIERERQVILQEISMIEDSPEEQVHDYFEALLWGHHPLGNPVLGSREVIAHMDRPKLIDHVEKFYVPDRIVVSATGNIEHQAFVDLLGPFFSSQPCREQGVAERKSPQELPPVKRCFTKQLEQAHLALGSYGLPVTSRERYKLMLLNVLLGGNMSSRLFQEVREKRGLAYSVHSYLDSYSDCGYLAIYLGVDPATINESLAVIKGEMEKIAGNTISADELSGAKDYGRAGLFLAAENLESRMIRSARNELYFGRHIPFEEVLRELMKVNSEDITELAQSLFTRGLTAAVLGPVTDNEVDWGIFDSP